MYICWCVSPKFYSQQAKPPPFKKAPHNHPTGTHIQLALWPHKTQTAPGTTHTHTSLCDSLQATKQLTVLRHCKQILGATHDHEKSKVVCSRLKQGLSWCQPSHYFVEAKENATDIGDSANAEDWELFCRFVDYELPFSPIGGLTQVGPLTESHTPPCGPMPQGVGLTVYLSRPGMCYAHRFLLSESLTLPLSNC